MTRKITIFLIFAIAFVVLGTCAIVISHYVISAFSQNAVQAAVQTGTPDAENGTEHLTDTEAFASEAAETGSGALTLTETEFQEDTENDHDTYDTYTVMIDPGHGFTDEGCSSAYLGNVTEKELTLDMALVLRDILESSGINVILTHDGNSFPSLTALYEMADKYDVEYDIEKCVDNNIFSAYERTIYANYLSAIYDIDLFVSIHVNAMEDSADYSGFEIDYCVDNDYSAVSGRYFESIIASVKKVFPDRTINSWEDNWEDSFIVTKFTMMPSILFETGFATNQNDAALLLDGAQRGKLMQSLASGIVTVLKSGNPSA